MLRKYEYMFIVDSSDQEGIKQTKDSIKGYFNDNDGKILREEDLGLKKLAYQVKKKDIGFYYLIQSELDSTRLDEIDRELKLNENILKYVVIKLNKEAFPIPEELFEFRKVDSSGKLVNPRPEPSRDSRYRGRRSGRSEDQPRKADTITRTDSGTGPNEQKTFTTSTTAAEPEAPKPTETPQVTADTTQTENTETEKE